MKSSAYISDCGVVAIAGDCAMKGRRIVLVHEDTVPPAEQGESSHVDQAVIGVVDVKAQRARALQKQGGHMCVAL